MVRAPAHALTRPEGFALLKPASRPQLDPARILTMSGTVALNLMALGLLMMPMTLPPPAVFTEPKPGIVIKDVFPDPPVVDIVDLPRVPQPPTPVPPTVAPRTQAPTAPTSTPAPAVLSDTGTEQAIVGPDTSDPGPAIDIVAPAGPAPMQLEYLSAPAPQYPRNALRQGITGTVMLQVLVGIDGKPVEVSVARGSGHRMLDDAARMQVLKHWRFRAAMRDGQPIQAIGLVPIEFALQR